MIRPPPRSTRPYTLFPYPALVRSTPLAVLRTRLENPATEAELREEMDVQLRRMNDLVGYQLTRAAAAGHKLFAAPVAIEPHAEQIVRGLEKIYAGKRSEEHTSELQSLMRISYAVFCLNKKSN